MKYIFPFTSKIDNDSDIHIWLSKKSFLNINDFELLYIKQFTFLPNFTPLFLFNKLKKIESVLERLINYKFGAHYMSVYKK